MPGYDHTGSLSDIFAVSVGQGVEISPVGILLTGVCVGSANPEGVENGFYVATAFQECIVQKQIAVGKGTIGDPATTQRSFCPMGHAETD